MINEFRKIVGNLNKKLGIVPLLYGSLGLQQLVPYALDPEDIDILIPKKYLENEWFILKDCLAEIEYIVLDLHEHEFTNGIYKVAFSCIEDLKEFARIPIAEIKIINDKEIQYKVLTLEEYLKVYEKSVKDSYRADKNNNKDNEKIKIIREELGKEQS